MNYYVGSISVSDELYHHGIKGQKWGIRRYQNEDGTLTPAGKARYGTVENFKAQTELKSAKKQLRRDEFRAMNLFSKNFESNAEKYRQSKAEVEKKQQKADKTDFRWKKELYKDNIARGRELSKSGFNRELAIYRLYDLADTMKWEESSKERYKSAIDNGSNKLTDLLGAVGSHYAYEVSSKAYSDLERDIDDYDKYVKYGKRKKSKG